MRAAPGAVTANRLVGAERGAESAAAGPDRPMRVAPMGGRSCLP
jgi:hypothetical protein